MQITMKHPTQIDVTMDISMLQSKHLGEMIMSMRSSGLAPNSIQSYVRCLRAFLSWCRKEELTSVTMPAYRGEESIKDPYNDEELQALLKKPNIRKCSFAEYRNWVMVCFLMNCGCRARTLRCILVGDVNLKDSVVLFRHTKAHKVQAIPLCSEMTYILTECSYTVYMVLQSAGLGCIINRRELEKNYAEINIF